MENEFIILRKEFNDLKNNLENEAKEKRKELEEIQSMIEHYKSIMETYRNDGDLIIFGIYEKLYDFDNSEKYKIQHNKNLQEQKDMLKNKQAAQTHVLIYDMLNTETKKLFDKILILMLRTFNSEVDTLIAKVKYNNVVQYEDRIKKAAEIVNKLTEKWGCYITDEYVRLRVEELRIAYEYQQKLEEEKEEQRRIKEQIREEEKARKEFEKAQREIAEEEQRYMKALEEAKQQVVTATGNELDALNEKIKVLEKQLEETEQKERAISQAQLTKAGFVYIISNIGSFGDNVYKIGMTRRLEPMDRVKELGDASVPFEFDVHAMISINNAPEFENTLHRVFNEKRVNMVNDRKEFFKVTLDEIEEEVKKYGVDYEFTRFAVAKEYRETLNILSNLNSN